MLAEKTAQKQRRATIRFDFPAQKQKTTTLISIESRVALCTRYTRTYQVHTYSHFIELTINYLVWPVVQRMVCLCQFPVCYWGIRRSKFGHDPVAPLPAHQRYRLRCFGVPGYYPQRSIRPHTALRNPRKTLMTRFVRCSCVVGKLARINNY